MEKIKYGEAYGRAQAREIPAPYLTLIDNWLPISSKDSVLEVGVGKGALLEYLQQRTEKPVSGIDLNNWTLRTYKPNNSVEADATALPFATGSFDKIVSMHTLEHVGDVQKAFSEMSRVLKPGGHMLHVVPAVYISKAEGAIIDTLRIYKFNIIKAWQEANKLHVHNFKRYGKMVEAIAGTDIKIVKSEKIYVPTEMGYAWVYLMEKQKPESIPQVGGKPKEILSQSETTISKLNPENLQDLDVARTLDRAAIEAYNPFTQKRSPEESHSVMTDKELALWCTDSPKHMLRVIEDHGKAVGFTYLYNDSKTDQDFRRRAQKLRKDKAEGPNHSVWEMNFWAYKGTPDAIVEAGVKATLGEFVATRKRETTTVMFIAEEDQKQTVMGARSELGEMAKVTKNEDAFQDTRVLDSLGFRYSGTMQYMPGDAANRTFSIAIGPKTSFNI